MAKLKIVVGITGASGAILGVRLLGRLREQGNAETHLIVSRAGEKTAWLELGLKAGEIRELADFAYPQEDIGSRLASGSSVMDAMIVAPCSIQSMSAIAHGLTSNLLTRAADVMLKERRKLILMVREMPFHLGHLRTMVQLAEMGAILAPPVPGFYHRPKTVEELVDHCVERVMDLAGVPPADAKRWAGTRKDEN